MHQIEFTRSRPYRKNDQAWVEQKNGAVVRRIVAHSRFSGVVASQALAHLYQSARLHVNFFQPSFKLLSKTRQGAKVKRTYDRPKTPCDRLLNHPAVHVDTKETLRELRLQLDPVAILHRLRDGQAALAALSSTENNEEGPGRKTLEQFLAQLPQLWRSGEVRPTHRTRPSEPRYWRTRRDPFENVWVEILAWLQDEPDATAKALFQRLQHRYPERFSNGQLRTMQRRVQEWRQIMASELVHSCISDNGGLNESETTKEPER